MAETCRLVAGSHWLHRNAEFVFVEVSSQLPEWVALLLRTFVRQQQYCLGSIGRKMATAILPPYKNIVRPHLHLLKNKVSTYKMKVRELLWALCLDGK